MVVIGAKPKNVLLPITDPKVDSLKAVGVK